MDPQMNISQGSSNRVISSFRESGSGNALEKINRQVQRATTVSNWDIALGGAIFYEVCALATDSAICSRVLLPLLATFKHAFVLRGLSRNCLARVRLVLRIWLDHAFTNWVSGLLGIKPL